jgi:hypothetical protein
MILGDIPLAEIPLADVDEPAAPPQPQVQGLARRRRRRLGAAR